MATVCETALIGLLQTRGSPNRMHAVWVSIFFSDVDITNFEYDAVIFNIAVT